jgi:DNA-binding CsgD family transcriptional regulator
VLDRRGALRLALAPLDSEELLALAQAVVEATPGPNLRELLGRVGGNPLLALELLGALREDAAIARPGAVAEIDQVRMTALPGMTVLHRLSHLSAPARELLRAASVLGTAFDVADLSLMTGRPALELAAALDEAQLAGAIVDREDRLAFRHELIRDAVYRDLPATLRRAMHRDFARALADAGAGPERVAEHLMAGARPGDVEAATWLRSAALSVSARNPRISIDLVQHAMTLVDPGTPLHGLLAADRALALMSAGDAQAGEQACEEVLTRGWDGGREGLLRRLLIRSMMFTGRAREALPIIEQGLAMPNASAREAAGFRGAASYLHLHLGDYRRALELADDSIAVARASGDRFARSEALNAQAQALGFVGQVERAAATGLESLAILGTENPAIGAQSVTSTAGLMLLAAGRVEDGIRLLRRGREINEHIGARTGVALHHVNLADGLYLSGEWDDAVAELEATIGLVGERIALPATSEPLLAIIAIHRNQLDAAQAHLSAGDAALGAGATSTRRHRHDFAAALWADAQNRPAAALDRLVALAGEVGSSGLGFAWPEIGPETVRRLVAAGRVGEAKEIAAELQACAAQNPHVSSIQGAALAGTAMVSRDVDMMLDAVAAYRAGSRSFDLARSFEDAAELLASTERRAEAVDSLRQALEIFRRLGAARCAMRATATLRSLGVRGGTSGPRRAGGTGWDALTPSERVVVELVAQRLTNAEIAQRLFISRRTVETHVSHALVKTGLRSRVELGAEAVRRGIRSVDG